MASFAEVKNRINVMEYARDVLGWDVRVPGDYWYSLVPGDNKRVTHVFKDWFYDFKTGWGGDVVALCAYAKHDGDMGAALRDLSAMLGLEHTQNPDWVGLINNNNSYIAYCHEHLRPEDWEYLRSRHITDDYTKKMLLGYDPHEHRLVIPYYKNGYVAYWITRQRDDKGPKYKKAKLAPGLENIPWGLHTLNRDTQLVIAEGAFDAMSFDQEGYRVLSPISGFFNKESLKQVLDICRDKKPFIQFDSDSAGNNFQHNMCAELFRHRIDFTCGQLSGVKDVSDYYCEGGSLAYLIEKAEPGIEVFAKDIKDKEEFKKIAFEAGRFISKPDMLEFFSKADHNAFDEVWLRTVQGEALKAPPEDIIVKEILQDHNIRFWDALGFYEYEFGRWEKKTNAEIQRYISDKLGTYRTGSRVSSIFKLLQGVCVCTMQLDRTPVFNFRNGTLELETGNFRNALESDWCTLQVSYGYDKEATCPRWLEFIDEICDGDEKKKNLLQEIAGYILFQDNSLQKCFFLLGEGANGKSVYLDILSAVIGARAVSNVEMSALAEPFQRIRLYSSMLNISTETQTNVNGAESVFKQLVVGDSVNGCYKGKDFIEFRTRAKFVNACNDYIRTQDLSHGFMRRIMFVNLTVKFSDDPKEGEKQADRGLTKKLMDELPGVFNWMYDGYKMLKRNQYFTVPTDTAETMEDYKHSANPVLSFVEDISPLRGSYSREELYRQYAEWGKDSGHLVMSRTNFIRRLRKTLEQMDGVKWEEYKTVSDRGFRFG